MQQTAIVVGGGGKPSNSIGGGIVQTLLEQGMRVAVLDEKVPKDNANGALYIPCDVTERAEVRTAVATVVETYGRINHLIYNAATSKRLPLLQIKRKHFRRTMAVAFWGAFYAIREVATHMVSMAAANPAGKDDRNGNIIVIGSPHALPNWALPKCGDYNAAKAGLHSLAMTFAVELLPHHIRVNVVQPGWIDTAAERARYGDEEVEKGGKALPWGLGCPADVANMVTFLCNDQSGYCTGSVYPVDGGLMLPWRDIHGTSVMENKKSTT